MADQAETQIIPASAAAADATQGDMVVAKPNEDAEADLAIPCSKCKIPLDAENIAAAKYKNARPLCKSCHSVSEMLNRHLGGLPEEFDLMEAEDQTTFWKRCLQMKTEGDGPVNYKKVRGLLVKSMVTREIRETSNKAIGEYRPLSYYEKLGYCVEDIEMRGVPLHAIAPL